MVEPRARLAAAGRWALPAPVARRDRDRGQPVGAGAQQEPVARRSLPAAGPDQGGGRDDGRRRRASPPPSPARCSRRRCTWRTARAARALFFAVTTGNDVFALDETTGAIVWSTTSAARRRTAAPAAAASTRSASMSTPVIDAASRTIFVAGAIGTSDDLAPRGARAVRRRRHREVRLAGRRVDGAGVGRHDVHAAAREPAQRAVAGRRHAVRRVRRPRRRLRPVPRLGHRHQRGEPGHEGRLGDGRAGRGDLGGGRHGVRRQRRVRVDGQPHRRRSVRRTMDSEEVVRITGLGTRADAYYPSRLPDVAMAVDGHADADMAS